MKRIFYFSILFLLLSVVCQAARRERDISHMVTSLHHEMAYKWQKAQKNQQKCNAQLMQMDSLVRHCNDESKECALMVYSTNEEAFLDMAFAYQTTLTVFKDFKTEMEPYTTMLNEYTQDVKRQDSLACILSTIDTAKFDLKTKKLLAETMHIIACLQANDHKVISKLNALKPMYNDAYLRLRNTNHVSQQKYEKIRSIVLASFDNNILNIISDWKGYLERRSQSVEDRWAVDDAMWNQKGSFFEVIGQQKIQNQSSWGTMRIVVITILLIYILIKVLAAGLIACLLRLGIKRLGRLTYWDNSRWVEKRDKILGWINHVSYLRTFVLVAVWVNFWEWFDIALGLQVEMMYLEDVIVKFVYVSGLVAVIVTCVLLRYANNHPWSKLAICCPSFIALFLALYCNVMVLPDAALILEVTASTIIIYILQIVISAFYRKNLNTEFVYISRLCLCFCILSLGVSMLGLQFLAHMVIAFWCNMLAFALLLTSLKHCFDKFTSKHQLIEKNNVWSAWWMLLITRVLYPMAWVYSVLYSCSLACSIYSLNEFLNTLLASNFSTPIGRITLNINLVIVICWNICFASYITRLINLFVESRYKGYGSESHPFNSSIVRVAVWGVFIINIMMAMGFSLAWVGVSFAGLSTGIGFASREIIENVIYGLTLRNGYLKTGDWIVCDSIRGQVMSIGVLSTRLDSVEGTVVNISNSQLFHRDFENATLNHGYELLHTFFPLAYGSDTEKVRKILVAGCENFDFYDKTMPATVYGKQFNDSWFDMDLRVWVPAGQYINLQAFMAEYVYKTLKDNDIEIPYPSHNSRCTIINH